MIRYLMFKIGKFCEIKPADRYTEKQIESKKVNDLMILKQVKSERTYWRHQRFMGLIGLAMERLPEKHGPKSIDTFIKEVTLEAGYFTPTDWETIDGITIRVKIPDEINFAAMDEEMFIEYFSRCVDVICCKYLAEDKKAVHQIIKKYT